MTSRRDFLKASALALSAATVGCASIPSERFTAGELSGFPLGESSRANDADVFILRSDEGVAAISGKCTHLGCSLDRAPADGGFHCNCHDSHFNDEGAVTAGPAKAPLDWFEVTIEDGQVKVNPQKKVPVGTYTAIS